MGRGGAGQVHVALLHQDSALRPGARLCCVCAVATASLEPFLCLLVNGCPQPLSDPDQCL